MVSSSSSGRSDILHPAPGTSHVIPASQVNSATFRKEITPQQQAEQGYKIQARRRGQSIMDWPRQTLESSRRAAERFLRGRCGVLGLWLRKWFPLLQGGLDAIQSSGEQGFPSGGEWQRETTLWKQVLGQS